MDRDSLRAEFEALVEPFERSCEYAISVGHRDTPPDGIVEIIRQVRESPVSDINKILDQAEEVAVCVSRHLRSLQEERHAVYHKFIDKLIHTVSSRLGLVRVVQSHHFTDDSQNTTSTQESTNVDAQQDIPTSAQNAALVKDKASESRDNRSDDEKYNDKDSESGDTQSSDDEDFKSGDNHKSKSGHKYSKAYIQESSPIWLSTGLSKYTLKAPDDFKPDKDDTDALQQAYARLKHYNMASMKDTNKPIQ
jgi:hypothetical protein